MSDMEKDKAYLGIDPGAKGSLAVIQPDGKIVFFPWDETDMYFNALHMWCEVGEHINLGRSKMAVEQVGAMPGQGVTSMFNFGKVYGEVLGVLRALGASYELVRPQRWMKDFGITSDKATHIAAAKRLFPGINLRRTSRCTKDDDGFADALLLAEWARRHMS